MTKYILQPSTTKGWWVVTDTEHGIVVKFQEHKFNDTQKTTLLNGDSFDTQAEALQQATYIRELADWLRENHYDKVF